MATGARVLAAAIVPSALLLSPASSHAQDFYKGKQISVVVGFGVGGGYDTYARLFARHIGNHIPGKPNVVVQNMEGGGSVRASNYVYVNAAKDGTVIAAVNQNMPMYSLLGGKAAQFDARRFHWIGSLVGSNGLVYTWHTSKTRTLEDAKNRETPLGGTGTNSDSHIFPTVINKLLGTRFKVINGYAGGSKEIHIAIERGEVEGRGGNSWAALYASNPDWVDQGKLNFLVQVGAKPEPATQLKGVPLLIELVAEQNDKHAVEVITLPTVLGYAYWFAPEVASERVETLRRAFDDMVKDPAFIADAEKAKMMITPKQGVELATLLSRAAGMPKHVLARTASLLEWKE
jgi:tripartite-type tricarboxylate transporter receptor subunit TctC